jgi:hypothetical protein
MSKLYKNDTIVLVSFTTPPIPACYAKSLYQHLFDNVWETRREAEEDVRVFCDSNDGTEFISEIRYQFGSDFYEEMADEIGELISDQFDVWLVKNCIDELQYA